MDKDLFDNDDLFSQPAKPPKTASSQSLLGDLESLISVLEKPQEGIDIPILKSFATEEDLLNSLAEDIPVLSDVVVIETVISKPIETTNELVDTSVPVTGAFAPETDDAVLMPPEDHELAAVSTKYNITEMIQPVQDSIPPPSVSSEGDLSWSQAEQILRKKADVFIQDLVDELIPQIESTLRKRLQNEFDALLVKTKQTRKL